MADGNEACNPEIRISKVYNEGIISLSFTHKISFPKDFANEINQGENSLVDVVMINGDT